jgi:hypothetical protein
MSMPGAAFLLMNLLTEHPKERSVTKLAVETVSAYETCPLYHAIGETEFFQLTNGQYLPAGVYRVGAPVTSETSLVIPIRKGRTLSLADIIGGIGGQAGGGSLGNVFFWAACRGFPLETNGRAQYSSAESWIMPSGKELQVASNRLQPDMGRTPSEIKASGGRWKPGR